MFSQLLSSAADVELCKLILVSGFVDPHHHVAPYTHSTGATISHTGATLSLLPADMPGKGTGSLIDKKPSQTCRSVPITQIAVANDATRANARRS